MKIAFYIHNFNRPNHRLQPRQFIHQIGKVLAKQGHEITVLTDRCVEKEIDGISVIQVNKVKDEDRELKRILESSKPDALIVSTSFSNAFSNATFYRSLDLPVLGNFSFPIYEFSEILKLSIRIGCRRTAYYLANHFLRKTAVNKINKLNPFPLIISQSERNLKKLSDLGIKKDLLTHIPPGIDKKVWYPAKSQTLRNNNDKFNFLFFGPMRKARGVFILLDAFKRISQQYENASLTLLLRGAENDNVVNQKLKELGIKEKVEVNTGWMTQEDIREKIWSSKAVVIPFIMSESDMPLTILEAKACGKPVIATDVCSVPEMVGEGGLVVAPNSVEALSGAMKKIIEQPDFYDQLIRKAKDEITVYPDWNDVAEMFLNNLKNVI